MRDFKAEHSRRQQKKKRISFEVDRQQYEKLSLEQKKILSEKIRQLIKDFLNRLE